MKETGAVRGDACKIGAKEEEMFRKMCVWPLFFPSSTPKCPVAEIRKGKGTHEGCPLFWPTRADSNR